MDHVAEVSPATWRVWYVFADFLNWEEFENLADAIREAAYWERQGLEAGIQGASGAQFDLSANLLAAHVTPVLP